ncbi:MAG: hypothetical protein JSS30_04945 [Verrucomicrobia bacterium]|nr:hypothetical protein [Verrucomicrobiota bacterium]
MLATIINFSSNEALFLKACLEQALLFSDQILVPVCDHFFDGTPENRELLDTIYAAHEEVQFIEYAWSKENFYADHPTHFWHNLSRLIGTYFLNPQIDRVLFLDVDEIVEGQAFAKWLKQFPFADYVAMRLACYWYFREAKYQALQWEDTPLLISKAALHYDALMHPNERAGTFHLAEGKKLRNVLSDEEIPMIHHYSWVRSKEALLRKVSCWGHRDERNWRDLVEAEFANEFSGIDFVHGYSFKEVEPLFKPHHYPLGPKKGSNVRYLKTLDIHKIDLELKFFTKR